MSTEKAAELQTSGKTQPIKTEGQQSLKLPDAVSGQAAGSQLQTFFGRVTPDASPGWNTLTITGLPLGSRVASVWMTEWVAGNFSHAGSAWYSTASVQLYDQGSKCRVRYHLDWGTHLPTGFMLIYGP